MDPNVSQHKVTYLSLYTILYCLIIDTSSFLPLTYVIMEHVHLKTQTGLNTYTTRSHTSQK
jgi:hypothetical protein